MSTNPTQAKSIVIDDRASAAAASSSSSTQANRLPMRVNSFDIDGCLFNSKYVDSANKDVIASNRELLEKILENNKNFSKNITFIGSNRQSAAMDRSNFKKHYNNPNTLERETIVYGSCFPIIQIINDFLKAETSTLLLADINNDLPSGTCYQKAIDELNENKNKYTGDVHPDWLWDETKATLLYAQIHNIATAHPTEEIEFHFYDDRKDILTSLSDFYRTYPNLIAKNVTLHLHHYEGDKVSSSEPIKGAGFIDRNYRQTVKEMGNITMKETDKAPWEKLFVAEFFMKNNNLTKLKQRNLNEAIDNLSNRLKLSSEENKVTVIHFLRLKASIALIEKYCATNKLCQGSKIENSTRKKLQYMQTENDFLTKLEDLEGVEEIISSLMAQIKSVSKATVTKYRELKQKEEQYSQLDNIDAFKEVHQQRIFLESIYPALSQWCYIIAAMEEYQAEKHAAPVAASSQSSSSGNYGGMTPPYDYAFNILIIGDQGCGKTWLIHRFCEAELPETYLPTTEFSFKTTTIKANDKETMLKIWDGMINYNQLPKHANRSFRGANGIIVCFDVTSEDSFNHVIESHKQIQRYASPDMPVVLVGNKVDLSAKRVISYERAVALAHELGFAYQENSAKGNNNVVEVFEQMTAQIFAKILPAANSIAQADTVAVVEEEVAHHRNSFWSDFTGSAKEAIKELFSFQNNRV